jgi:hypothetical protein
MTRLIDWMASVLLHVPPPFSVCVALLSKITLSITVSVLACVDTFKLTFMQLNMQLTPNVPPMLWKAFLLLQLPRSLWH